MPGGRQHYQPAALIGGFGRPAADGDLRNAEVAVRRKLPEDKMLPGHQKAENVAFRRGMYTLASPPAGVDPGLIDSLWDSFESPLPDAIRRLGERRELDKNDAVALLSYAAAAAGGGEEGGRLVSLEGTRGRWASLTSLLGRMSGKAAPLSTHLRLCVSDLRSRSTSNRARKPRSGCIPKARSPASSSSSSASCSSGRSA